MDSRRKCSTRPLKIITNFFFRNGKHKGRGGNKKQNSLLDHENNPSTPGDKSSSLDDCISAGSTCRSTGDLELDALHLSRRDNPYLQILSSRECLLSESPPPPPPPPPLITSPTRSSDPLIISPDSHSHLVRSPPPLSWPISPRSGTFSPTEYSSVDCLDEYRRSHSEEHILGSRSINASMMLSPVRRGATPEFAFYSPSYTGGRNSRLSNYRGNVRHNENECLSPKSTQNDVGASMSVDEQFLSGSRSYVSSANHHPIYRSTRTASVAHRRETPWRSQWRNKSDIKSMENLINDGAYTSEDRQLSQSVREEESVAASPRYNRSFHLRKSITLRPKSGPSYMDIESQS